MMMVPVACLDQPLVLRTVSVDVQNYNQRTDHGSLGFPVRARTTINGGVFVGSSSTATFSYTVGSGWAPGSIPELIINGEIQGRGGNGGDGGSADGNDNLITASPTGGANGGPALDASGFKVSIRNNGAVRGGGGGGGGGGAAWSDGGIDGTAGGSSGGGGRGSPGGSPGGVGTGVDTGASDGGQVNFINGNSGASGSTSSAGGGGAAASCPIPQRAFGGAGGDGGAGGANGSTGATSNFDPPGEAAGGAGGGTAGACTSGNSNITWVVVGTREGALN